MSAFTLARYCQEQSLPYADVGLPVPIETFVAYGLEFQKRFVAQLEETEVTAVARTPGGFELTTQTGEIVRSKRVVVAAGITHFGYIPPMFAVLPQEFLTHSSDHKEVSGFKGRRVAVIGAGASAVDLAGLLQEAGADTHLIARRATIAFHEPSSSRGPSLSACSCPALVSVSGGVRGSAPMRPSFSTPCRQGFADGPSSAISGQLLVGSPKAGSWAA